MVVIVTMAVDSLRKSDPGRLSSLGSSSCPKKRSLLPINPHRLQPWLIGQRVSIPPKEPKVIRNTEAPIWRSPSFNSEELKAQFASDPLKLRFFLEEFSRRIRRHVSPPSSWPRVNKALLLELGRLSLSASFSRWHSDFLHLLWNIWIQKR